MKLFGHAVHPMLIVFPLGLLSVSVVFDIVHLITDNGRWADISFWMIVAGVIGGASAGLFGWIDWFGIPNRTRAKSIGLIHGLGNMIIVVLFAVSAVLRMPDPTAPPIAAIVLSVVGVLMALVTGWLGGELVYRLGIAVDEGAHADAPSSLSSPVVEAHLPERKDEEPGQRAA